ncbi:MAG: 50S ribosomal protein L13 [Candidatus Sumerlaeia bacterium]
MKTYSPRKSDIQPQWYHVDAGGQALGRVASQIAYVLRGKHLPTYAPHVNPEIYVVVTNADRVVLTGRKWDEKMYHRHSGWPGGLKSFTARQVLARKPEMLVEQAVKRMLPKGALGHQLMRNLKVYAGEQHPHSAQKPETIQIDAFTGKGRKKAAAVQ